MSFTAAHDSARSNAAPRTNRAVFREAKSPICEVNPATGKLAMMDEPFHALAVIQLGKVNPVRVCSRCAETPALKYRQAVPMVWRKR